MSTSQPKTMLITGATGFIGARLATLAMQQGYQVKTLTRSNWDNTPAVSIEQRYFGNMPTQIPPEAVRGVDIVVHCAAQLEGSERGAYAINVDGTVRIAEMARRAGAQTFIFLSSQSARADAISAYGKTKYAAEQALLQIEGLNVIILRPGLVTGPGSRGLFQRMSNMVKTLPIVPLLGGGKSIVQPIHVDDLCTAVFRCAEMAGKLKGAILNLGDAKGVSLAEFLQAIAIAQYGRPKRMLAVPIEPIMLLVKFTEMLRLPLPINSNNLQGLKIVEKMETGSTASLLGLQLRPVAQTVQPEDAPKSPAASLTERAVRALLIGAGRVGLVHAVTLSRLTGLKLVGMVDPNPKATTLLKGMGLRPPTYTSLDQALAQAQPDIAVIATPVATHLSLTRTCLEHKVAVMVEKPLALRAEQLAEYEKLLQEFPEQPVQVGYVMLRNPQVVACLERLRAGEFGQIQSFTGITLLSLIQAKGTKRWEVKKDVSGGGVLINSGGHVLSMIRAAFGEPTSIEVESLKLFSEEVEDSLVARLVYPNFSGVHYCSWSINGFPRQENRLIIQTDRGYLILTGSMGVFVPVRGDVEVTHQLDFNIGFNMAPDYAGGGFTLELTDLQESALTHQPAPVSAVEAIQLERLLFKVYAEARPVRTFTGNLTPQHLLPEAVSGSLHPRNQGETRLILDLRDLSPERTLSYLHNRTEASYWDEYLLTPAQIKKFAGSWPQNKQLRVTVPDFLNQSRLLSNGRYGEVLQQMGPAGMMGAALGALPLVMSEHGPTFWVAATGLLAASLKSIPASFSGTILLHTYLTDFALSLRRLDVLDKMLKLCRQACPHARVGLHTNLAGEALNALWLLETPVDEVSALTSPHAVEMAALLQEMRRASRQNTLSLTAEVGLAPDIVHRLAADKPECWAFGAEAVLVGPGADSQLAGQHLLEVKQEWDKVFPGITIPDGIL